MSDTPDKDSRTEAPSERRIADALEKGNIPVSREAATAAFLVSTLIVMTWLIQGAASHVCGALVVLLGDPGSWPMRNGADVVGLLRALFIECAIAILPILIVLSFVGLAVGAAQSRLRVIWSRVAPDPSRISIGKGLQRLLALEALIELSKTLLKLMIAGAISYMIIRASMPALAQAVDGEPFSLPERIRLGVLDVLKPLAIMAAVIAGSDVALVRMRWHESLRMSRQEVLDEHRETEGDPVISARRMAMARSLARNRMLANVETATLVVANPTHFAVALRYVQDETAVPKVVAKGKDLIALKIREVAERRDIPVIEDKALARSLYDKVEVDQVIPAEFYRAIADILIVLHRSRRAILSKPDR